MALYSKKKGWKVQQSTGINTRADPVELYGKCNNVSVILASSGTHPKVVYGPFVFPSYYIGTIHFDVAFQSVVIF